MKKLSKPMEDMITGAAVHEVRIDGKVVKIGYVVAGRSGTIVALMDRDLVTAKTEEFHGLHWLTPAGVKVYSDLVGTQDYPSLGEDITPEDHPTESDMITDALPVRTPGAFMEAQHEAEIAEEAATVTDYIDAELDMALIFAEVSRAIEETFDNDRLMHLTPKGVFVSASYVSTMRRIAAQRAFSRQEWREYQGVVQAQSGEAFKTIDQWVAEGKISFRMADKQKRIIRNISRPSMLKGRKHKASKSR